jgi:hypothetical protein
MLKIISEKIIYLENECGYSYCIEMPMGLVLCPLGIFLIPPPLSLNLCPLHFHFGFVSN